MEILLTFILIIMILGSIYLLYARDLLSAVISYGIVGFGLVICFLLLKAPDLAIIQIVIETMTLIIMIAVILDSSREISKLSFTGKQVAVLLLASVACLVFLYFFIHATLPMEKFGEHTMRMSRAYIENGAQKTGSVNLVTGVLLGFRAYDTLGEATILFTAAIGVLTVLRLKGKKTKVS